MQSLVEIITDIGFSLINSSGIEYLLRCHDCGKDNYSTCINKGVCCHCGWERTLEFESIESMEELDYCTEEAYLMEQFEDDTEESN